MHIIDTLYGCHYRGILAGVSFGLFLLFSQVLFTRVAERYQPKGEKPLRLQTAWSAAEFKQTLLDWSNINPEAARIYKRDNLIKLDLLFPLIYASFFAFAYACARGGERPARWWDYVLFIAPFVAALLDYCENGLHLYLLSGVNTKEDVVKATFDALTVHLTALISYIKIALFIIGVLAYHVALFVRGMK